MMRVQQPEPQQDQIERRQCQRGRKGLQRQQARSGCYPDRGTKSATAHTRRGP